MLQDSEMSGKSQADGIIDACQNRRPPKSWKPLVNCVNREQLKITTEHNLEARK